MSKELLAVPPLVRVNNKQVADNLLRVFGNLIPYRRGEVVLTMLNFLEEDHVVLVVEGRETAQQDIEDDSDTPIVTLFAVGILLENFWSYVPWGTASSGRECLR